VAKFCCSLLVACCLLKTSIQFLHIARVAHGVLNKNKNFVKNFISRPCKYLSQKTSCGQGAIFARIAHIRVKGREIVFFENLISRWVAWP